MYTTFYIVNILYITHGTAICHNPHTIHQNVISTLLDSWVTNTLPVKILHLQKFLFLIFL